MVRRFAKLLVSLIYFGLVVAPCSLLRAVRPGRERRPIVLCYHGVRDDQRCEFAWHMNAARQVGCLVALDGRMASGGGGELIAITFDDGFANELENALPLLEGHQVPATIFVSSERLGSAADSSVRDEQTGRGERIMTADELRGLNSGLFTVGSHGASHVKLGSLSDEEALQELVESKRRLEGITGREVSLVAFPHGCYTERTIELAQRAGYRRAFSLESRRARVDTGEFVSGRFWGELDGSRLVFWLTVRGAYAWLGLLQRLRSRVAGGWGGKREGWMR